MTLRPDGVGILGVRVTLTTDDGALISTSYSGVLDLGDHAFQSVLKGDFAPGDVVKVDVGASDEVLTFTKGRSPRAAAAKEATVH